MENKINIAELLKDCPEGMELNCTMFENTYFDYVDVENNLILCYSINDNIKTGLTFSKYGTYSTIKQSKCVIFPKGKTTWEGFQRPFKDGDIIFVTNNESYESFHYKYIAIFKEIKRDKDVYVYGLYSYNEDVFSLHPYLCEITNSTIIKFATKEEKEKLFKAIKENGYKWNPENKTLEKLPKFKVGNRIKYINGKNKDGVEQGVILSLTNDTYDVAVTNDMGIFIPISEQDDWELVPNKFDINTLKVFDKVLVRDSNEGMWSASIFSHTWGNRYICIGVWYNQCIPYEGNEHLLGTANDCDEYFKNW